MKDILNKGLENREEEETRKREERNTETQKRRSEEPPTLTIFLLVGLLTKQKRGFFVLVSYFLFLISCFVIWVCVVMMCDEDYVMCLKYLRMCMRCVWDLQIIYGDFAIILWISWCIFCIYFVSILWWFCWK